ncbi:MAG: flagellar export protein FliJ [Spirochaetaceae bacterium]|jgi:flagellar FliJ protein|nr:flagellar export protein FliJ [Spirochaetaceae bacterium]
MKQFVFNLQKVLELRSYYEREAEIDLGRAVGALTAIENNIEAIAQERHRIAERFSAGYEAHDILVADRYLQRLSVTKDKLLKEAAEADKKVEAAREIYLNASRDRKILDKVREGRQHEYHKAMLLEEVKETDDLTSSKSKNNSRRLL